MQLIWVLVPTNDVLYNWIIMVLEKCKRIPIKKESIIGLEGRLKILWVEKYSKSCVLVRGLRYRYCAEVHFFFVYWINTKDSRLRCLDFGMAFAC